MIHGIARGTAQVTIKQNGYDIYNSTVPPGPFTINDIYAAGNSGDLQVTIKEADGSTQIFTVPYSSVPLLQREGIHVIPLRQENTVVEMRNRKNPAFSRVHYSTAFRLAGQYMVERNWRIVIVLLISVSGKTWGHWALCLWI